MKLIWVTLLMLNTLVLTPKLENKKFPEKPYYLDPRGRKNPEMNKSSIKRNIFSFSTYNNM